MMNDREAVNNFNANDYPLGPGIRLIEASAGTGKTFALAHLVLRLITEKAVPISNLLVVTFTEAAAAEIRSRISERIESALIGLDSINQDKKYNPPDSLLAEWLERVKGKNHKLLKWKCLLLVSLEEIDSSDITTIHGFCSRTLRREALANGSPIDLKIEGEDYEIFRDIAHEYWQNQILRLEAGQILGIEDSGLNLESYEQMLLKVDSNPSLKINNSEQSLDVDIPLYKQFEGLLEKKWEVFLDKWKEEGLQLEFDLRNYAKQLRSVVTLDTKPFSPNPTKDRYEIINRWIEEYDFKQNKLSNRNIPTYGLIRSQPILKDYFHPEIFYKVANRLDDSSPTLPKPHLQNAIADLCDGPAEQIWYHALSWGTQALAKRRSELSVISYGGLLEALDPGNENKSSHEVYSSRPELIASLRNRYKVVLIDEFQDTDPIQWRILHKVFGNTSKHLLVMIGDPKQAIYRFRGSDLKIYMKAREKADRIDILQDNFRTSSKLMNGLNKLMASGLSRSNLIVTPIIPRIKENKLHLDQGEEPLQLLTLEEYQDNESEKVNNLCSKSKLEEIIPRAVAESVLNLFQKNKEELIPSDICILVNRHDQAERIRSGLAKVGLPTRLMSKGDILASEAAEILQKFLNCLAYSSNSNNLRLIACSALMEWNINEIRESETNGNLNRLAVKFQTLAQLFTDLGVIGCLTDFLEEQQVADLSKRGRLISDIKQCAQLVQEEIHNSGLDVVKAAEWLSNERLRPIKTIPENRKANSDDAENAIAILTIHRSKGLEFRVVICPYLWQAPPLPNGPLWKCESSSSWFISICKGWGKGKKALETSYNSTLEEAERIAYVASTRARDLLILVWGRGIKQEGNPLTGWLFGPKAIDYSMEELCMGKMRSWLINNNIPISIHPFIPSESLKQWQSPIQTGKLGVGPIPNRRLDKTWGRSSYSSWITEYDREDNSSDINPYRLKGEHQKYQLNQEKTHAEKANWKTNDDSERFNQEFLSKIGPLVQFPRGTSAGNCLHRILEQLDFCKPINDTNTVIQIKTELRRAGLEQGHLKAIQDSLARLLEAPLGLHLKGLRLNQLVKRRRIHELSFDLPIAHDSRALNSIDIARIFEIDSSARFSSEYAQRVKELNIQGRGFLSGSIDLVFTDEEDLSTSKWWVLDWKSNWIGDLDENNNQLSSGPFHYQYDSMEKQMLIHHYPLQAHLYLVALHRFLLWRLPNYNPEKHLGGYAYIFLRGLPDLKAFSHKDYKNIIPGQFIERASIKRILAFDHLLKKGGQ